MDVPRAKRPRLLATFNSGFKLSDSSGGFVLGGHTYASMRDGQGTLVGYADGHVDVIDWSYGSTAPPGVSFARQNLPLIVNEGKPNPNLANDAEWGATVGNAVLVWRSGVGVDGRGNLIYAAGEDQTVSSLARTLIRAGAVRAMELDINSYWVSFISYGAPGAEEPKNLLPAMNRPATRYLGPLRGVDVQRAVESVFVGVALGLDHVAVDDDRAVPVAGQAGELGDRAG
jgi:hypothetical protein